MEKDEQHETSTQDTPKLLWHFTTLEALPKILIGDDGLLAGHTSFMSDPDDCALANRVRVAILRIVSLVSPVLNPRIVIENDVQEYVGNLFGSGGEWPTFIACFTDDVKNSRKWAEITKNGGFAIGFDRKKLLADLRNDSSLSIGRCKYDEYETIYAEVVAHEQTIDSLCANLAAAETNESRTSIAVQMCKVLERLYPLAKRLTIVKKSKYGWEREYRVVCQFEGDVPAERVRFIGDKPFVTLVLPKHINQYVKTIVISPFGDPLKSRITATIVGKAIGLPIEQIIDAKVYVEVPNTWNGTSSGGEREETP